MRKPTIDELADLQIYWLTNNDSEDRNKLITIHIAQGEIIPIPRPWDKILGNSPKHMTAKALAATTQL